MKSSFLLCANWKMNKDPEEVRNYLRWILRTADLEAQKHFIFFVPALSAFVCRDELVKSSVQWGGQNCYFEDQGAFTGENSPQVLRAMGARYCLVGHSERRHLFGEDDNMALLKVRALWRSDVQPVLCVGETREEKESGQSIDVVRRQLYGILEELKEISKAGKHNLQQSNYLSPHLKNSLKSSDMRFAAKRACSRFAFKAELVLSKLFKRGDSHNLQSGDIHAEKLRRSVSGGSLLAVAYEPVWAIGAGSAADSQHIRRMCEEIRTLFASVKKSVAVLYGGSVNENNIAEIFNLSRVDGFLVGGASLKPDRFFQLFKALQK